MHSYDQEAHEVQFSGRAGEWFGIWIVNLLLTIITFGIYSAWAKVRRNKYFYGNTSIGGRGFDYHATGMQILIGRIIVIAVLIVYNVAAAVFPPLAFLLIFAFVFVLPWLLIRAAKFSARNTSWSNVRFDFDGRYWDAFITFILAPIGVALTLYTTLPLLTRRMNRFIIEGHRLGNRSFSLQVPAGSLYLAFGVALLFSLGMGVLLAVILAVAAGGMFAGLATGEPSPEAVAMIILPIYLVMFLVFFPATILYRAMVRNAVYGGTELQGGHRFASMVHPGRLIWIVISNAVIVVLTVGLMLPWAQIRLQRYLAESTVVIANGSLDQFAGEVQADGRAIGDAFSDIEGFDIGAAGI
ncbi:MAG: YjgN family protein [Pseudomonadota bacterium]